MTQTRAISTLFFLYNLIWALVIPFLKRKPRIADGIDQRLLQGKGPEPADIWIQSASAGESYLTATILEKLDTDHPLRVLLTTNTRQGLDILDQCKASLAALRPNITLQTAFAPFDKPALMDEAVKRINPKLMVLVELEMWPGLLSALKKNDARILVVNGRLTEKSFKGYRRFPGLCRALSPDEICAISADDARRFDSLFPDAHVRVVPNIKFDRVATKRAPITENPVSHFLKEGLPYIVLGSIREDEEPRIESIIQWLRLKNPDLRILLFPRHMHRVSAWAERLDALNIPFQQRSRLSENESSPPVVIWDMFGELALAYDLAQAAFVGGSLAPLGGQNFLEVLHSGLIPVCGPSWDNFFWVGEDIVKHGLLMVEQGWEDVAKRLLAQITGPISREDVRQRAANYIEQKRGGTRTSCEIILTLIQTHHHKES